MSECYKFRFFQANRFDRSERKKEKIQYKTLLMLNTFAEKYFLVKNINVRFWKSLTFLFLYKKRNYLINSLVFHKEKRNSAQMLNFLSFAFEVISAILFYR